MSRSVLVTGGAGFIGSHLVEALVARGDRVRVLDDLSSGRLENLGACSADVEVLVGDVRDAAVVERVMAGVDAAFHEAAIVSVARSFDEPELVDSVNVGGSVTVLAAARRLGLERVVFASSAAVYGDTVAVPVAEDAPTRPLSPYGVGKLAVEGYARCLAGAGGVPGSSSLPDSSGLPGQETCAEARGLSVVCLRYFNVFGPRQDPSSEYSGVIARFLACAAAGERYTIFGDGAQTRDFVYVGDVVRANLLALDAHLGPAGGAGTAGGAAGAGAGSGAACSAGAAGAEDEGGGVMSGTVPDSPACWCINVGSGRQTSVLELAEAVARVATEGSRDVRAQHPGGPAVAGGPQSQRIRHEPARSGEVRDSCADISLARTALQYEPGSSLADGLRATWESLRR